MSDVTITAPCPSCRAETRAEFALDAIRRPALYAGQCTSCGEPIEIRVQLELVAGNPRHVAVSGSGTDGSTGG
ncbi:hypothetical protein WME91_10060 [Sorangium sp. So ce269]